jgi:hypothetical protein
MKNLYEYQEYSESILEGFNLFKSKEKRETEMNLKKAEDQINDFDFEDLFKPLSKTTSDKDIKEALSKIYDRIESKLSSLKKIAPNLFNRNSGARHVTKMGYSGIIPHSFGFLSTPDNMLILGDKAKKLLKEEINKKPKKK